MYFYGKMRTLDSPLIIPGVPSYLEHCLRLESLWEISVEFQTQGALSYTKVTQ